MQPGIEEPINGSQKLLRALDVKIISEDALYWLPTRVLDGLQPCCFQKPSWSKSSKSAALVMPIASSATWSSVEKKSISHPDKSRTSIISDSRVSSEFWS